MPHVLQHGHNGTGRTGEKCFDGAVGAVAHPAGKAEQAGTSLRLIAEADALDAAADKDTNRARRVRHSASPRHSVRKRATLAISARRVASTPSASSSRPQRSIWNVSSTVAAA